MCATHPEFFLSIEIVYAAAFAMLLSQLRDQAGVTEVLQSVQRLCALARVGAVTLRDDMHDADASPSVQKGLQILRETLQAHDLAAIDLGATMTDAEFIKLAGILVGPSSTVYGSILETADALSIWNARLHVRGMALRPTPPGMQVTMPAAAPQENVGHAGTTLTAQPVSAVRAASPVQAMPAVQDQSDVRKEVADAVAANDAARVLTLLEGVEAPAVFVQVATMPTLVLVAEHLVDVPAKQVDALAVLRRAGMNGARALFMQLMAATEASERRILYDAVAAHGSVLEVARAHLAHPTWYVARNAASLLGETRSAQAIPDLSKLLRHEDQRVRVAAVASLGRIGGAAATATLESVLTDPASEVRHRALAIVFASPESDPFADRMLMALEEESTLDFQLEMVHALANVPTPRARRRLEAMVAKPAVTGDDYQLLLAAMAALAAGHRPAADPILHRLLDDPSPTVAERAAALLG